MVAWIKVGLMKATQYYKSKVTSFLISVISLSYIFLKIIELIMQK